ncbi:MAG: cytidine deaminase [Planctomycetales bacterium]|nr:cytidine deaminase [Planctomycetales bacterium]
MTLHQDLLEAALRIADSAYAPYSSFHVGAAIRSASGNIYTGCNVENASYGLSICAERSAVAQMISAGERTISAICVASDGGVTPCGACRQVLIEFGEDFSVLLVDRHSRQLERVWQINELLPGAFRLQ